MKAIKMHKEKKLLTHNGTTSLTICEIQLIAQKPFPKGYNINPVTIGDYLREYRIGNSYTVFELSLELDVYISTIYKWENNIATPKGKNLTKVIEFMGFDPRSKNLINNKNYELN